jgi:tRNA(Ile)-lysidine synthase
VRIWRPFLSEPRDVVRDYIELRGLLPVEDETNQSIAFQRNAIRHRLLPVMEKLSPGAAGSLARFAALAAEDDRYLASEAKRVLAAARNGPDTLSIDPLGRVPLSVRRRAILMWLSERFDIDPSQDRVDAILELIERKRHAPAIEVGGGYLATIVGADLVIRRG